MPAGTVARMCGRFVSSSNAEQIAQFFDAALDASFEREGLPVNHNVAPTTDVYGVVADRARSAEGTGVGPERVVRAYHWGLVPSWAKDTRIGSKMINARAETIAEKPAFKRLLASHRLIVPMDGFYEWQAIPGSKQKQPYFIRRRDGLPLAAAGLWAAWRDPAAGPDAPWLHSCTVITTSANAVMGPVHDRMPAFLPPEAWQVWLDPTGAPTDQLLGLLGPSPDDLLELIPVSTDVNNVRNRGEHLIERCEPVAAD